MCVSIITYRDYHHKNNEYRIIIMLHKKFTNNESFERIYEWNRSHSFEYYTIYLKFRRNTW